MARVFVKPEALRGERTTLDESAHRHLIKVLRLGVGATIRLFDGAGCEIDARIESVGKGSLEVSLGERRQLRAPACTITLMQSVPRGDRMDLIVQKTTELGVAHIVPVLSQHGMSKPPPGRTRRWQTIAEEAARQSGRADVPTVEEPLALAAALTKVEASLATAGGVSPRRPTDEMRFILWEGERQQSLPRVLGATLRQVVLLVGPEGGFASAEVVACAQAGFQSVGLGPRVLRTETAAIVAVALTQAAVGGLD
jgi:16S rRNA (uracil1498-N3)-methyltransferase